MQRRDNGSAALGAGIPMLLLVLVFLLSSAVLLQAFSAAWRLNREATAKNDAVQLCRSAAEAFAETGTAEGTAALLGCNAAGTFDRSLSPAEDGVYTLSVSVSPETTGAGVLQHGTISVSDRSGCLFTLETSRYEGTVQP